MISQMKNKRRNDPVLLVRKLFHKAESVVIWLGESSHDSAAALDLIPRVVAAGTTEPALGPVDANEVVKTQRLCSLVFPEHFNSAWKALGSMFWRPWFSLVSVIQKVPIARGATVLYASLPELSNLRDLRDEPPHLLSELMSHTRDNYSTDDRHKVFALLGIVADGLGQTALDILTEQRER